MKNNTKRCLKGASLALAAAGLVGCWATADKSGSSASLSETVDLVHCYGVNACEGQNECKTANNACNGHGDCRGTGFVTMPADACENVGGQVADSWQGSANTIDLSQCYGVNACEGHNECKTANNECKGKGSCHGTGFINMSEQACFNIGGEAS